MSAYLVTAVIVLFDNVEDHTSDGTNFVFIPSRQGKNKSQGDFALLIAVRMLKLHKEYLMCLTHCLI